MKNENKTKRAHKRKYEKRQLKEQFHEKITKISEIGIITLKG